MSVVGRFPARELRGLPVGADGLRARDPRAELRLRELRVLLLELNAVRVPRPQVRDQHLARELVLAAFRNREVDLQEGVRVTVEHGRNAVLLEELDILEPVEVRPRRRRLEVDVFDERDVLLVRKATSGEVLRVERDLLLGLVDAQSGTGSCKSEGK